MSNILKSEDFGLKIYNRFPPKYREDDAMQNYSLMRYLQALSDGGFKYSIEEINGIADLIDPDNVGSKVLPVLFKQYGLELFNGIPEQYLRYLLPKLGEAWSKKGSLSVVEFITSSIAGVKTSSDVSYDDQGNPIINVKLEMDYSLGDYFPEAGQFSRLLENFIPFYSDVVLIYSYLFYETQVLRGKDGNNQIDIQDHKTESGGVRGIDSSYIKNKISQITLDIQSLSKQGDDEYFVQNLVELIKEQVKPKYAENLQDIVYSQSEESTRIRLYKENGGEDSSVFGEAVFGNAVLNVCYEVDTWEDFITGVYSDSLSFSNEPLDTFTNREYNTLNGKFYTNGLSCYNIVTIGDKVEIIY